MSRVGSSVFQYIDIFLCEAHINIDNMPIPLILKYWIYLIKNNYYFRTILQLKSYHNVIMSNVNATVVFPVPTEHNPGVR